MKISKYTFLFEDKEEFFMFNSLSKAFLQIDKESYDILLEKQKNKSEISERDIDKELFEELKKWLMLCENHKDEFLIFKSQIIDIRNSDNHVHFTIAPTMNCCFSCFYCFEKGNHRKTYITEEVMDSIIKNIESRKNLQSINITWFGGEPLLNFKRIKSLTEKILNLDIKYNSDIITNGYLLDKNKLSMFEKLHINSIQLTIDGMKEEHDKRRPHISGKSSFDKIIENLDVFFSKNRNITMNVRVNIDKNNENQFYQLYLFLKGKYPNINVAPAFVFIKDENNKMFADCMNTGLEKLIFNMNIAKEMDKPFFVYPTQRPKECIARSALSFVIGANGDIFKCYDNIGSPENRIGNINTGELNSALYSRWIMGADPLTNDECIDCKLLPVCGGACPMLRLENERAGKEIYNLCHTMKDIEEKILTLHLKQKENLQQNQI